MVKKSIKKVLSYFSVKVCKQRDKKIKNIITYYPRFNYRDELSSHYHRASWYLPRLPGVLENVYLFQKIGENTKPGERPSFMCSPKQDTSHILVKRGIFHFARALLHSRLILVWRDNNPILWKFLKFFGVRAINVDTNDLSALEYGKYCGIFWHQLLNPKEKNRILSENYQRFYPIAYHIIGKKYSRSCVFGTGPSLEKAYDFDFTGTLTIVCNSIVQNKKLLDHIKPAFICAGDVISHLGVSLYAEKFREDLITVLKAGNSDHYFVTSAAFGYLFTLNHPEMKDKTILIDQTVPGPNYDLLHGFGLPLLASTLNIHMLPLASSFTNEIFLLGCDGKGAQKDDEDFWAHAKKAQYYELVNSGHLCHPTFDVHRQQKTYEEYIKSLETYIMLGENNHGKTYWTLQPSNVPVLKSRLVPKEWRSMGKNEKAAIATFPGLKRNVPGNAKVISRELPVRSGLSQVIYNGEGSLFIKGWILSPLPIDRIDIFANESSIGTTMLEYGTRPDVYKKFPEYNDNWIGFRFYGKINCGNENLNLVIKFFSNKKIVKEIKKNIKNEKG